MKKLKLILLSILGILLLVGCNFTYTRDKVEVKLGIDNIDDHLEIFEGKRVGLITNPTGINSEYESTIDILFEKVNLVSLFAPEHGIRGDKQAGVPSQTTTDEVTGLPVYSLYGQTQKPTKAMMDTIDILCIDLQDAGARFYTYIYTMAYAMEASEEYDKEFVVFDRPNPAGGEKFEGNILEEEYKSFVGNYPIVQRHGMTIGELAKMFNEEFGIGCKLTVIEMTGWKRSMYFDETNLPWVIPSPNFPSQNTALVYPGTCIFEGTNLSEGRGTTIPFEVIGAPYIDAIEYANALNELGLKGVKFRPAHFTPTFSKHANVLCHGVQVHVTDRDKFEPVKTGWAMLDVVRNLYPEDFQILNVNNNRNMLNLLTGTNFITQDLYTLEEQFEIIEEDTAIFGEIREKYLIY
ncbi:MAG TPA: DUF1343 domain-containing protein [Acholeplasmataceae bacterium]|nr:DUF1343 domain-containing protein [Acholeplasmataceae bacterium]